MVKISEGVEWALHSLIVLAAIPEDRALPAARLAEFHELPAAYLAKHLQALSRAGLLESVPGPRGGYRLGRSAASITVLEVVLAVDGLAPAFTCTEIRRRGPAALADSCYRTVCGVHRTMARAEEAYRAVLRDTTVAELVADVLHDADPEGLMRSAEWLRAVLR
jgi:Rrf2 family protein